VPESGSRIGATAGLRRPEIGQLGARAREDPPAGIAHGHVQVEVLVEPSDTARELLGIADALGEQGRRMPRDPLGDVADERPARADGEDDARGEPDDQEHAEEVEVDAPVEPTHLIRPRA
jgi:hypothetical protein